MENTWPKLLIFLGLPSFSSPSSAKPAFRGTSMAGFQDLHLFWSRMEGWTVALWSRNVQFLLWRHDCSFAVWKQSFSQTSFSGLHCDFSRTRRSRLYGWIRCTQSRNLNQQRFQHLFHLTAASHERTWTARNPNFFTSPNHHQQSQAEDRPAYSWSLLRARCQDSPRPHLQRLEIFMIA